MRRRNFLALPIPAALLLNSDVTRAYAAPLVKLRISATSRLTMCPFYTAYESGYFADAGLDIELVKDMGTAQSLPLLAGGKIDGTLSSFGPPVVNAIVRGARVRVVAGREVISSACGTAGTIFVSVKRFPHGIQTMRQLKGARIALSQSPQTTFWFDVLIQAEGMRDNDFQTTKMREGERVLALRAGGIDAYVSSDADFSTEARDLGVSSGPRVSSLLPNYQFSHIMFGRTLLDGPVDTGARFLRAYFRGASEFLQGKTPKFMDEYAQKNDLDPKLLREGCRGTFERDGTIHMKDLQLYTDWMGANALAPAHVNAADLVDNRFLEAARRP